MQANMIGPVRVIPMESGEAVESVDGAGVSDQEKPQPLLRRGNKAGGDQRLVTEKSLVIGLCGE